MSSEDIINHSQKDLKMRKKALALSLSILFFGSITASSFAITTGSISTNIIVDNDDDKDKNKKSKKSKDNCKSAKSCCDYKKGDKSCKDKDKVKEDDK